MTTYRVRDTRGRQKYEVGQQVRLTSIRSLYMVLRAHEASAPAGVNWRYEIQSAANGITRWVGEEELMPA